MTRGSGKRALRVRRRLVLYLHGLDPRGPGLLHRFQRDDAGRESARPDRSVTVGPRQRQPLASAWTVTTRWSEDVVEADYVVLRWDDLIRSRWIPDLGGQARSLVRWLGAYVRSGALTPLASASRTSAIGMLVLPASVLAFCLLAALVLALSVQGLSGLAEANGAPRSLGFLALGLTLLLPAVWRRFDTWANVCWLGRGHLHMVELSRGDIIGIEDRIDRFVDRLLDEVDDGGWDDILVVGHSSGALHAVSLLGLALLRRPALGRASPPVRLITLGHSLPPYALLGPTARYARALSALVEADWISWTDVTAAADPGAAGAFHPLAFSPHAARSDRVVRLYPRFHRSLAPEAFRALKRNPMAYHFQYMRPSDDAAVYDWHRLAFGPGEVR